MRSHHAPTNLAPGGTVEYRIYLSNEGDAPTDTGIPITASINLPPDLTVVNATDPFGGFVWNCTIAPDGSSVSCTWDPFGVVGSIPPAQEACENFGEQCALIITINAEPDASGAGSVTAEVCGGGSPTCASEADPIPVDEAQADFEIHRFEGQVLDGSLLPSTQAASYPFQTSTRIEWSTRIDSFGNVVAAGDPKTVQVDLPPGFIVNPNAVTKCPRDVFAEGSAACPISSQVGIVRVRMTSVHRDSNRYPLYNLEPGPNSPANFGFNVQGVPTIIDGSVRTGGDYGLRASVRNISQVLPLAQSVVTLWGIPADPAHDRERGYPATDGARECSPGVVSSSCSIDSPENPLVTNPTDCSAGTLVTTVFSDSWSNPGIFKTASFDRDPHGVPMAVENCEAVPFGGNISVQPTNSRADSPSGLHIELTVPQSEAPDGLATAHLKKVVVTLPEGMSVNPSSADGLGSCSPAEIGLDSDATPRCPDTSKIGTVEVDTPLLDEPLTGSVYVAKQNDNPFNSLLAIYIVVEGPGVLIKLPGHVEADPNTGQLTTVFDDNPQLPFETLTMNLFGGPRAALVNPPTCGSHQVHSELSPWSAADPDNPTAEEIVSFTDSFQITSDPNGQPCANTPAERPNSPKLEAGTLVPLAGDFSTLLTRLSREDGSQEIKGLDLTLPPGLVGKLAGLSYCPEAALAAAQAKTGQEEQQSPSCPESSKVGTVHAGAGAGSNPLYVPGNAYLSGPYKGAPLSLAVITPAVAGPFDLGTVVVRAALEVDPVTAQVHAITDEIPHILQGIPLHLRDLRVILDRPEFALNPTSCEGMAITGSATGAGASLLTSSDDTLASLFNRFQVGGCRGLGFKPRLALNLKGGTDRGDHPSLRAVLRARPGDANIARAAVTLPRSEFLDQGHIRTVCTRVQFAADQCPKGSIYGRATAITPLLDQPLTGPVYLRSSDNELPDLVADLNGQIEIELAGRIDSVKGGGIRTTFASVPDAPVSKFILTMKGGRKGLLVNSTDLCDGVHRASAKFDGHNGRIHDFAPRLRAGCGEGRR
jgi:hypothetical protein